MLPIFVRRGAELTSVETCLASRCSESVHYVGPEAAVMRLRDAEGAILGLRPLEGRPRMTFVVK